MSLLNTNTTSVTIKRGAATNTDGMGNTYAYTTGSRGSLPTSGTCRVMKASAFERQAYGVQDENATDYCLFTTNPRCDNRDQIIIAATSTEAARTLNVLTQINVQELSRLWILSCQESSRGVK